MVAQFIHRVVLLFALGMVFAGQAATRTRPNILLLVSDDQRVDSVSALGSDWVNTPNLDRLAREGVTFTRATCANPHCVPSRAEILTGASGFQNGVSSARGRFNPGFIFLGEAMQAAGYQASYSGKWMNDGQPKTRGYQETRGLYSSGGAAGHSNTVGYSHNGQSVTGYRGWTFKQDDGSVELDKGVGLTADTSRHIADAVIGLIGCKLDKPFFIHANFTAPHDPLVLPPDSDVATRTGNTSLPANFLPTHPFDHGNAGSRDELLLPLPRTVEAVRRERAAYALVVEDMDRHIGRIFTALEQTGAWENTVVVFTSDHGLALGSHGLMGKQNQYEHTIRVPLLFRGPGLPAGSKSDALCYLRDLYPTFCELAGTVIPPGVQGRSLLPVLKQEKRSVYPYIFGHYEDVQRMVRDERWKLIWYPKIRRWQLFDLKQDPDELNDLSGDPVRSGVRLRLHQTMAEWFKSVGDPLEWGDATPR
jgi:arylsulfatase A-like enzyme